jgi:hypothetical protein
MFVDDEDNIEGNKKSNGKQRKVNSKINVLHFPKNIFSFEFLQ